MKLKLFHGSNAKFAEFSNKAKRILNDNYGGGIAYFTDTSAVALTYAKSMTRKYGGTEYIYHVELDLGNIFDVDYIFTKSELTKLLGSIKPEAFARGAGLLKGDADKYKVLASLELGNLKMSGEEVFKGLSNGYVQSNAAESVLKDLGYDGLRYNGGVNMSAPRHNVYIAYYAKNVRILDISDGDSGTKLHEETISNIRKIINKGIIV